MKLCFASLCGALPLAAMLAACNDASTAPHASPARNASFATTVDGVAHFASVGSSDIGAVFGLPPGAAGNFSLVATQLVDGSVTGQWEDASGRGFPGGALHVVINCLNVVGNQAWVSGVATEPVAFLGAHFLTRVMEVTSPSGAPDEISFSQFQTDNTTCLDMPNLPLFPITGGEVTVR
jgi:hypothetical protein